MRSCAFAALILVLLVGCDQTTTMGSSGPTTGGKSCWLGLDAGSCNDDSQCPAGDYCDFSEVVDCSDDAALEDAGRFRGPIALALGTCFPSCKGIGGTDCTSDEDCVWFDACYEKV